MWERGDSSSIKSTFLALNKVAKDLRRIALSKCSEKAEWLLKCAEQAETDLLKLKEAEHKLKGAKDYGN